jgi:hypothetical protein
MSEREYERMHCYMKSPFSAKQKLTTIYSDFLQNGQRSALDNKLERCWN